MFFDLSPLLQAYSEAFNSVHSDLAHAPDSLSTTTQTKVARAKALQVRSKGSQLTGAHGNSPSDAIDGEEEGEEEKADERAKATVANLHQQIASLEQQVLEVCVFAVLICASGLSLTLL